MARTWGGAASDVVTVTGHTAIDNLSPMSVAVWAYRTGDGGSSAGRLVQKGNEWFIWNSTGFGGQYRFDALRWSGTNGRWTIGRPGTNAWRHTVVTYGWSGNPVMYTDGANASAATSISPSGTDSDGASGDLLIGNDPTGVANWAGRLAHVGIWNRILTPREVLMVYYRGPLRVPRGLVTYLPLDGLASPEPNWQPQGNANRNATVTGTVYVDSHPRVNYTAGIGRHRIAGGGPPPTVSTRSYVAGMLG